jgi:hypothetical protein
MPLVPDPNSLAPGLLRELRTSLRDDLEETRQLIERPGGRVLDPASLATASELLTAALARLELPSPETGPELAADVNLAYAALVAIIDLVKSHTDVPTVPRKRSSV